MARLYRYLVLAFLFFTGSASAVVPLETQYRMNTTACEGGVRYSDWAPFPAGISNFASIASCKTSASNTRSVTVVSCNAAALTCTFTITDTPTNGGSASTRSVTYGPDETRNACPANSSGIGSCTCNAGYVEKNGQCVQPDNCAALANWCSANKGSRQRYAVYNDDASTFCHVPPDDLFWDQPKFPGCSQGCQATKTGMSVGLTDEAGKVVYRGEGKLNGGKCSYSDGPGGEGPGTAPDAPEAPKSDAGQSDPGCAGFKGTVGDKTVCIPATGATGVDWSGTTNNSDGTKSETKTTTTCSNGICETTKTTTNKDAAGNTTGTTTSTERHSQLDYCSKNPTSQVCAAVNGSPVPGKDNTSGGTGTGGGTGSGNCNISNCSDTGGGGPGKVGFPGTGAGGEIGQLYQPKYPDGPVKLWSDKSATLKSSGLGSLALKLFPQVPGGGTPPQWVVDFDFGPLGSLGVHDISPPQWLWDVLKAIVILTALITARRLIFGG